MNRATDSAPDELGTKTLAISAWIAVQVFALLVAASDVSPWARAAEPTSNLALPIILIAQLVFASLLAPLLFTSWLGSVSTIAVAIPFACLAGLLSAASATQVMRGEAFASAWMITIAGWSVSAKSPACRAVFSSIATALTLGLAVLAYVSIEFRGSSLVADGWSSRAWFFILIALGSSVGWRFARRLRKRVNLSTAATNNCG